MAYQRTSVLSGDNYLVFYKTNDETETVYIVRIMYRGRDVRKQLSRMEDVSEN